MKKLKVIGILCVVALIIIGSLCWIFAQGVGDVRIVLDGKTLEFDTTPVIVNGRVMVPMSGIFKELGMEVEWDSKTKTITAVNEEITVILQIGSMNASVNGVSKQLDASPYISNSRTLVPLSFVSESTGAQVNWNGSTRTVTIKQASVTTADNSNTVDSANTLSYPIVHTGVTQLYTDTGLLSSVSPGNDFYGQDGNYIQNSPSYKDNGDGTVTDLVTGLMWQQTMDAKMTAEEALDYANECMLGGYDDWRIPNIKELFSLIIYTGQSGGEVATTLFIDTDYFDQPIGDTSIGEREIDAQTWSSTAYVGKTMHNSDTIFGVNFIDGRIKGYGEYNFKNKTGTKMYYRLVRGNEEYGINNFVDNKDGTITDLATGLMWQMKDDGNTRDWESSLAYAENLELAGHDDWRLPNAKELQSIVDYTKSPQTTNSPAINELFSLTSIIDEKGDKDYGYYWTGTTHLDGKNPYTGGAYVSFGEAVGYMNGTYLDVHGAGTVKSDPKSGDASKYPDTFGPQGDVRYVYNFALAVREIN